VSKVTKVVRSHGKLIAVDEIASDVPPGKRRPWRRHFIMMPWVWRDRLLEATRTSTWCLATWLLYEYWRSDGQPIAVSNIKAREAGLSRRSKTRVLAELQRLDLVVVERHQRQSPQVTLKHLQRD
jgi:hypothetical protein